MSISKSDLHNFLEANINNDHTYEHETLRDNLGCIKIIKTVTVMYNLANYHVAN